MCKTRRTRWSQLALASFLTRRCFQRLVCNVTSTPQRPIMNALCIMTYRVFVLLTIFYGTGFGSQSPRSSVMESSLASVGLESSSVSCFEIYIHPFGPASNKDMTQKASNVPIDVTWTRAVVSDDTSDAQTPTPSRMSWLNRKMAGISLGLDFSFLPHSHSPTSTLYTGMVTNVKTHRDVMIKIRHLGRHPESSVHKKMSEEHKNEVMALQRLQFAEGVAHLVQGHMFPEHTLVATMRRGPSLHQVLSSKRKKGGLKFPIYIAHRLALRLLEIHRQGVVHMRINPSHILTDTRSSSSIEEVFFHGFGHAILVDRETGVPESWRNPPFVVCNDEAYIAPEVKSGNGVASLYPIDVYALGMVLRELLLASSPTIAYSVKFLEFKSNFIFGQEVNQAIDGMLSPDPTYRWSLDKVVQALEPHRYVTIVKQ